MNNHFIEWYIDIYRFENLIDHVKLNKLTISKKNILAK